MEREELNAILNRISNLGELARDRLSIISKKDKEITTLRAEVFRLRESLGYALLWTDEEYDVRNWRDGAKEALK